MNVSPATYDKEKELEIPQIYMNFQFYRLDDGYRSLLPNEKVVAKQEYLAAFDRAQDRIAVKAYALTGLRADCDLLIWRISRHLRDFHAMTSSLRNAGLGKYLRSVHSYLGTVDGNHYIPSEEEPRGAKKPPAPIGNRRYLFVVPAHGAPAPDPASPQNSEQSVVHLVDGKGLDDTSLVVAYETDDAASFRGFLSEWKDAPTGTTYTCLQAEIRELVDGLG